MNTTLLNELMPAIQNACTNHHVKTLHIFGSFITDKFNDKSDIDLIVVFKDSLDIINFTTNFIQFRKELHQIFHRKIDLFHVLYRNFGEKSQAQINHDKILIFQDEKDQS